MVETPPDYPVPDDEGRRLEALRRYDILDTEPETAYDDLVDLAATICGTPTALLSLIDANRQWFKARHGYDEEEIPREQAFCARAIMDTDRVMVVEDATDDPRFADNPLVTAQAGIRFYAGAPIVTPDGHALGTICVLDTEPRDLGDRERHALHTLSRHAARLLELRRTRAEMHAVANAVGEDLRDPLMAVIGNLEMIGGGGGARPWTIGAADASTTPSRPPPASRVSSTSSPTTPSPGPPTPELGRGSTWTRSSTGSEPILRSESRSARRRSSPTTSRSSGSTPIKSTM